MESPVYHSGSLTIVTTFAEPAFGLPHAGPGLHREIYRALHGLDLDPAGLLVGSPDPNPSAWYVSANFLRFSAVLKVRIDGIEFTFLGEGAREDALQNRVLASIEHAVTQADPEWSPARRTFLIQAHGTLADEAVRRRIPSLSTAVPEAVGDLARHGVGLYFTNPLFSDRALIILEHSAVVDEGLFVQVRCEFAAKDFERAETIGNFHSYLSHVEQAFELQGMLTSSHDSNPTP